MNKAWWDAAYEAQGHTGWADRQVYAYDQPLRRYCVRRALNLAFPKGLLGKKAIDAGCGTGDFTIMLREFGASVIAFDFSDRVLTAARKRVRDDEHIRLMCASVTAIPSPDCAADAITCVTVLQHVVHGGELHRALRELRRVVKPQGRILVLELAPPLQTPKVGAEAHVIERPASVWGESFGAAGLTIEQEVTYPQWGITGVRLLAQLIDRVRSVRDSTPVASSDVVEKEVSWQRQLLRSMFSFARMFILAVAWPLDHVLRLPVPKQLRYYRLWILRPNVGEI